MVLEEIVKAKKDELVQTKKMTSLLNLKKMLDSVSNVRSFASALKKDYTNKTKIIAEVKRASPSRGVICNNFDPVKIAQLYDENGAVAVSVLTEEKYFLGNIRYLQRIKENISLPVLRKDFIFDAYQIYESKVYGADAILLIAAILTESQLKDLLQLSETLSLNHLVEVHTKEELAMALNVGAAIVGINNRNLKNFKTDISITLELVKDIPKGKVIVSESGIRTRQDIQRLKNAGVHAFLIGETLMSAPSPGQKLRELVS